MPIIALSLVIAAAALHAGWNLILKQVEKKQIITWWALIAGAFCFLPVLLLGKSIPDSACPYAIISATVEGIYFLALIYAYQKSDFSFAYPIARGAAPALLAIWAMLLLGEHPQPAGIVGLTLLFLGLIVVGGGGWWSQRSVATLNLSGLGAALGVALCISIYSAIDGTAVRFAPPASYTVIVLGLSGVFITPLVFARYGYRAVAHEWRAHWVRILAIGILNLFAYTLVLQAYAIARI